ncbi:MAG: DUF2577 domain-containing protein [Oscillospiraceae bacterium]|nr:DUF2577 domain-containing protein [Oscillospiraceae bacterium]
MDIAGLIKTAAVDAVEAEKPVCVMYGTIRQVSPLTIDISDRLILSGGQLSVISDVSLSVGDSVALLREQGGQRFVVFGKLSSAI